MKPRFDGEVALVTGGSSGIGYEVARQLVEAGARVWISARNPERLDQAAEELGPSVRTLAADCSRRPDVSGLVEQLGRQESRLDLLVNSAGQMEVGPDTALDASRVESLMACNYLGTIQTTHACLPLLRQGRRRSVISLSSLAGCISPPWMAAYAASKHALNGHWRALRQELHPEGFHLGLLMPGPVVTPMTEGHLHGEYYRLPPGIPVADPEQVATACMVMLQRRNREMFVPQRVALVGRMGAVFPGLVDRIYRWFCRRPEGDLRRG